MTTIETEKKISPNSIDKLFAFLTDMNNFERLMPADKIEKWNSTTDQCEFTIKGMTRIGLKIDFDGLNRSNNCLSANLRCALRFQSCKSINTNTTIGMIMSK